MISLDRLASAIDQAFASPEFGSAAWLTFYLMGDEADLRALASRLSELGAENLDGAEGGFVYAKLPVEVDARNVQAAADQIGGLAEEHNVVVDHIDLDSSADVTASKFFCVSGTHR
jgi:hypothetical protein